MARKRIKTDAFSVVLREIRNEKELSQEEVACGIDVDRTYISYLESGKRYPSIEMVIALAHVLGVRPGEIVDRMAYRMASGRAMPVPKQSGPKKQ